MKHCRLLKIDEEFPPVSYQEEICWPVLRQYWEGAGKDGANTRWTASLHGKRRAPAAKRGHAWRAVSATSRA